MHILQYNECKMHAQEFSRDISNVCTVHIVSLFSISERAEVSFYRKHCDPIDSEARQYICVITETGPDVFHKYCIGHVDIYMGHLHLTTEGAYRV